MISLLPIKLADEQVERVRRNHHDAIEELRGQALAGARIIRDVSLANAVVTPIAHKLGRPVMVFVSAIRGASTSGRIEEVRDGTYDRSQYITLEATGYGATITVDLLVVP